ncbi:MAG: hypothetical protein ACOYD0_03120 [Candidatus Nanopelagicales bacterium]
MSLASILRKSALLVSGVGIAALTVAACSSSSDTTPSQSPTPTSATATTSPVTAECTTDSILAALPEGSTIVKYNCANVAGTQWAAVKVNPGPTVFFLQEKNSTWDVSTSDEVCGTASAGLPETLLNYCSNNTSPTATVSPAGATCTSGSLLAALPSGAKMVKYNCANVAGTQWAAVKVNPGNTVFFLQKKGSKWNAQEAGSVCGTASAGLPQVLLDYCS